MEKIIVEKLLGTESTNKIYVLESNFDSDFYSERTNRNIGWITKEEQELLKSSVVGIAGCGGMGGLLASILLRLGVGKIKLADTEAFDVSNINRQFGALKGTVGKSKAITTAMALRDISDDTELEVLPMGITTESVDLFFEDCDLVCDEIEFWAMGSKILLHKKSKETGIPVLSCNTVGHQANLTLFNQESRSIELAFGYSLDEAMELQERIQNKTASLKEVRSAMNSIIKTLVPDMPDYDSDSLIKTEVLDRLEKESTASIIATNPAFAAGFLANHVLFQLLQDSGVKRDIVTPPPFPGYLTIDSALIEAAKVVSAR
jgi:tRNA A37 threonylcarbamoyladenosine dehydratase